MLDSDGNLSLTFNSETATSDLPVEAKSQSMVHSSGQESIYF